jgi:predicted component of type VI protein secretion system
VYVHDGRAEVCVLIDSGAPDRWDRVLADAAELATHIPSSLKDTEPRLKHVRTELAIRHTPRAPSLSELDGDRG